MSLFLCEGAGGGVRGEAIVRGMSQAARLGGLSCFGVRSRYGARQHSICTHAACLSGAKDRDLAGKW